MLLDDSSGVTIEVTCALRRQVVHPPPLAPLPPNTNVRGGREGGGGAATIEPDVRVSTDGASALKPMGLTATGRTVDLTGLDVGAVVKVKGGVGVFRGEKQVVLERICR
jgi:hypothetical protein